jgi:hypothetical protein
MVVVNTMILVYPLNVMGMPTYLVCVDLLTPFLNPLLMFCILTLEYVEPLVDLMHAHPEHVCPLDHLYYHLLSGMMINIMNLVESSNLC